jgi:hypothetical protein
MGMNSLGGLALSPMRSFTNQIAVMTSRNMNRHLEALASTERKMCGDGFEAAIGSTSAPIE